MKLKALTKALAERIDMIDSRRSCLSGISYACACLGFISLAQFSNAATPTVLQLYPDEGLQGEFANYEVKFIVPELPTGTALQFDLNWDTLLISSITPILNPDASDHLISYNDIGDGQTRIVVYSMSNATITVEGLLEIKSVLAANVDTGDQPFTVTNVELADPTGGSAEITSQTLQFEVPSNLATQFNNDFTEIDVTWDGIVEADSFSIYRSTIEDFENATNISNLDATSFNDDTIGVDQRYYYWAQANYEFGSSSLTPVSFITPFVLPPSSFTVTNVIHPDDIALAWIFDQNIDSVEVFRSIGQVFEGAEKIATLTGDEIGLEDATAYSGIPYNYWIRGTNAKGPGELSPITQGEATIEGNIGLPFFTSNIDQFNNLSLSWLSSNSRQYQVAYSHDLRVWETLPQPLQGTGDTFSWTNLTANLDFPLFVKVYTIATDEPQNPSASEDTTSNGE